MTGQGNEITPPARPLGNSNLHFWLVSRMAKLTETDLVEAMRKAELTQADWAEMVNRCRGCGWSEGCQSWLDDHPGPLPAAPDRCLNRERFQALKKALEEARQ
jgi:hypothetical protein